MLTLKNIIKDYGSGDTTVRALKDVSLDFRKSEFVSILGPSGCGKTTLLNIIGGLDQYTSGDLVINGTSTKEYKDRDWDSYRNHSVGFVFQSYNLIPHQTVLQNVELALTLSGVSKAERRARAKEALEQVGLGNQLNKRPAQMSGGQMQRVAIARALVNDPDIILADEPTGALDTETSVQVMEILKSISDKRLIVMVTHNPELAETYSTRIIRMLDGEILSDSNPLTEEELAAEERELAAARALEPDSKKKVKKPSMSFATSFMLSLKNLFTKKGRTVLTSFAGSIGIIGIALILSVSQGMTNYINHVQETTLSSYPLTLEAKTVDMTALIESFMNVGKGELTHDKDAVYKDPVIAELLDALRKVTETENDLGAFKTYLEAEMLKEDSPLKDAISGVQYSYALNLAIYTKNQNGNIIKSDTNELMTDMLVDYFKELAKNGNAEQTTDTDHSQSSSSNSMMSNMMGMNSMWQELLPGNKDANGNRPLVNDLLYDQYDVVHGTWPTAKNEIVLILNENNELDDLTLYALGLLSEEEIDAIIDAAINRTPLPESGNGPWTYEQICALTFKTILPYDCYQEIGNTGIFQDVSKNDIFLEKLYNDALELKVVGIIRPNENAESTMLSGAIGYTYALTDYVITEAQNSAVVKAQLENPTTDVLTGLPFESNTGKMTDAEKKEAFLAYVNELSEKEKAELYVDIKCIDAVATQADAMTKAQLDRITDKEQILGMISNMPQSGTNLTPEQIREFLAEMTLDELKGLIQPYIYESVAKGITQQVKNGYQAVPDAQKALLLTGELTTYTDEKFAVYYDKATTFSTSTYDETLVKIGCLDLNAPAKINLYASSFENKDIIVDTIAAYNDSVGEEQKIAYTDYLGIMMSSITTIINAISYVLIAFVSISLIVSSIMIGVITLISVQERTKEIGILRAIGASKRDVSGMFNAETMIIGFTSGLLGVIVTYLLCIPINAILNYLTGIANLKAILPFPAALILIAISVSLTLISGIIPSRSAAKKDPVVALRTE